MSPSAPKLHLKLVTKALNFLKDEKLAKSSNKKRRQLKSFLSIEFNLHLFLRIVRNIVLGYTRVMCGFLVTVMHD